MFVRKKVSLWLQELANRAHVFREMVGRGALAKHGALAEAWRTIRWLPPEGETAQSFSNAIAQGVAYGAVVLWSDQRREGLEPVVHGAWLLRGLPTTSPLLKGLVETLERALGESAALAEALQSLLDWLPQIDLEDLEQYVEGEAWDGVEDGIDPLIHFYERFLTVYDPGLRQRRGIYYTPWPLVQAMVNWVDESIREEWGLALGLADTTTWRSYLRQRGAVLDETLLLDEPVVRILDPATGTGTFLLCVVARIFRTLRQGWESEGLSKAEQNEQWTQYVHCSLLPRIAGFELNGAPYTICHMRLRRLLQHQGCEIDNTLLFPVFLLDTLSGPSSVRSMKARLEAEHDVGLEGREALYREMLEALAWRDRPGLSVVLGNPPYRRSIVSRTDFAKALVAPYKEGLEGEKNLQPLGDDYISFLRFAESRIEVGPVGILGLVTNNTYLSGRLHRGLRQHLGRTCSRISIVDLRRQHQYSPEREEAWLLGEPHIRDDNVFPIQQGVAVLIARRLLASSTAPQKMASAEPASERRAVVDYRAIRGKRSQKLDLLPTLTLRDSRAKKLDWQAPLFLWDGGRASSEDYASFASLEKLFAFRNVAGKTGKDSLFVAHDKEGLADGIRAHRLRLERRSNTERLSEAERKLRRRPLTHSFDDKHVIPYLYRPWDRRWAYYEGQIWTRGVPGLFVHCDGQPILLTSRIVKDNHFAHALVTRDFADVICLSPTSSVNAYAFPLWEADTGQRPHREISTRQPNLDTRYFSEPLPVEIMPEQAFAYIYAMLYTPSYRKRFAFELRHGFPRIPRTPQLPLFERFTVIGEQLQALHLREMEAPRDPMLRFQAKKSRRIQRVGGKQRTLIDCEKGRGTLVLGPGLAFHEMPLDVWCFHLGGYQACYKWLDTHRKAGRSLSNDDVDAFLSLVGMIQATLASMEALDNTIEGAGGWTQAFCKA